MNKKYRIEYLSIAEKDLTEIIEYIKLDNPQSDIDLLEEIDKTISRLEYFPYIGKLPKDSRLQYLNYRILVVSSYIIFYVVTNDIV